MRINKERRIPVCEKNFINGITILLFFVGETILDGLQYYRTITVE